MPMSECFGELFRPALLEAIRISGQTWTQLFRTANVRFVLYSRTRAQQRHSPGSPSRRHRGRAPPRCGRSPSSA